LKVNQQHVTRSHYISDQLPKVDNLIPPIVAKDPIGDIEKTYRNPSICSFLETIEAKSTIFHLKVTNLSPFIESTKSYSESKYDIDTSQNISTRIFKTLYKIRTTMSNQVQFNCWRATMPSLFLSIYKLNTKPVTTTLYIVLGHLSCLCLMLWPNSLVVLIVTWLPCLK